MIITAILGGIAGAIVTRVAIDLVLDWREARYDAQWLDEASDDWLRLCGVSWTT